MQDCFAKVHLVADPEIMRQSFLLFDVLCTKEEEKTIKREYLYIIHNRNNVSQLRTGRAKTRKIENASHTQKDGRQVFRQVEIDFDEKEDCSGFERSVEAFVPLMIAITFPALDAHNFTCEFQVYSIPTRHRLFAIDMFRNFQKNTKAFRSIFSLRPRSFSTLSDIFSTVNNKYLLLEVYLQGNSIEFAFGTYVPIYFDPKVNT